MVPVSGCGPLVFAGQVAALETFLTNSIGQFSPENAFAAHVLQSDQFPFPSPGMLDRSRLAQAPTLAAAGYCIKADRFDDKFIAEWLEALGRLSNRDPFPSDRASFFFRPVELLGVCLGTANAGAGNEFVSWIKKVLADGEPRVSANDFWFSAIARCAATECGIDWAPVSVKPMEQMDVYEMSTVFWLCRNYPGVAKQLNVADRQTQVEKLLLLNLATMLIEPKDSAQAAVVYSAAKCIVQKYIESAIESHWQIGRDRVDTITLLTHLFSRFPLFARQLTSRYDNRGTIIVSDEYDVQDLVHALLKLHFIDIRPEECTPSYAGSASRTDFLLKPEQVVVEVKMTRKNLGQKEVANQLILDKERYKTHQDCKHLVCFVYDPTNQIKNPHAVESDVAQNAVGILPVTVIVSPKGL